MEESTISPAIFVKKESWSTSSCKVITLNPDGKHINIVDTFNNGNEENSLLETIELSNESFQYDNSGMKLEITEAAFDGSNEIKENITVFDGIVCDLEVCSKDSSNSSRNDSEMSFDRHIKISVDNGSGSRYLPTNANRVYLEIGDDGRKQLKVCPNAYPKLKMSVKADPQTADGDFSCPFCGRQFVDIESLVNHLPNHKAGESIRCSFCDFSTVDRDASKMHVETHKRVKPKRKEKTKKNFECLKCDFATGHELRMHVHVDKHFEQLHDNCFECQTCHKQYKDHVSLRKHKLCHAGVRPFVCSICGADFFRKAYLTLHTRYSHADKPFGCAYCPFKFSMKSSLTLHERTHTGEKPFQCKECDYKAIGSKMLLAHHRYKHSVHSPFRCATCGKGFHTNSSFLKHTKTHLKNNQENSIKRTTKSSIICAGDELITNIKIENLAPNHMSIT